MKTEYSAVLDTDDLMFSVFNLASNDLMHLIGSNTPYLSQENLPDYRAGFPELSAVKWSDPMRYKAKYQLRTLLKRYITKPEKMHSKTLVIKAYEAFVDTQERISAPRKDIRLSSYYVCQRARRIIRDILGPYDPDEHLAYCRFGKRAAVGLGYRTSYLDARIRVLTGSRHHLQWFRNEVAEKDHLLRSFAKSDSEVETQRLSLTTVPKAWDKLRTILKNTVVGGFYSAGLGDLIVAKLKEDGYNLNRRQEKHRAKVKDYSKNLTHVTADLSAASDSFSWSLMNRLFPRDWYVALKYGAIRNCTVGSRTIQLQSFMTMGVGFTFPCQTLAFYAILRAVHELLGLSYGFVSVFGDDLIYPKRMHSAVVAVLTDLGFLLNKEKTFVTTPFRESCGADFYDGVDVRPFQPEGSHEVLSGLHAVSYLYQVYNGLACRWQETDLPTVFNYLRTLLLKFTEKLHQVPVDYPSYSGIQTDVVRLSSDYLRPTIDGNGSGLVQCLSYRYRLREVPFVLPYLWDHLRVSSRDVEDLEITLKYLDPVDSTTLIWVPKKCRKSQRFGPPLYVKRLIPHVNTKGSAPRISEKVVVDHRFVVDESKIPETMGMD